MKKRVGLPIMGLLVGCAAVSPWIFAVGQQALQALSTPAPQSAYPPPSFTQTPVIEAKTLSTEVALSTQDEISFQRIMKYARDRNLYQRPIGNVMQAIAEQLLDTPYQEKLLDESSTETLPPKKHTPEQSV